MATEKKSEVRMAVAEIARQVEKVYKLQLENSELKEKLEALQDLRKLQLENSGLKEEIKGLQAAVQVNAEQNARLLKRLAKYEAAEA